jgi:hypothetical protein
VWWSVALSGLSVMHTIMLGNKWKIGWLVAVFAQVLWSVYAVVTRQWGFLLSAAVFTPINVRNYVKWNRDDRKIALARVEEVACDGCRHVRH